MIIQSDLDFEKVSRLINTLIEEGTTSQLNTSLTVRTQFAYDTDLLRLKIHDGTAIRKLLQDNDISNVAYGPSWNGVTDKTASLDVLYDALSSIVGGSYLPLAGGNMTGDIGFANDVKIKSTAVGPVAEYVTRRATNLGGPVWNNLRAYNIGSGSYNVPDNYSLISQNPSQTYIVSVSPSTSSNFQLNDSGSIISTTGGGNIASISIDLSPAVSLFTQGSGGVISLRTGTQAAHLRTSLLTATRTFEFPDQSGTFALLSDIPSVPTLTSSNGITKTGNNFKLGGALIEDTALYSDTDGTASLIWGTTADYSALDKRLKWLEVFSSVDNILQTGVVGGYNTSIGAGTFYQTESWTFIAIENDTYLSELFVDRTLGIGIRTIKGSNFRGWLKSDLVTANREYQLPDDDGTIALLSDIPSLSGYLPLSGGTMSGDIDMDGNDILTMGRISNGTDRIIDMNYFGANDYIFISANASTTETYIALQTSNQQILLQSVSGNQITIDPTTISAVANETAVLQGGTSHFLAINNVSGSTIQGPFALDTIISSVPTNLITSSSTIVRNITFQDADGTLAFLSDISGSYLPLTGGVMTGDISMTDGTLIKNNTDNDNYLQLDSTLIKLNGGNSEIQINSITGVSILSDTGLNIFDSGNTYITSIGGVFATYKVSTEDLFSISVDGSGIGTPNMVYSNNISGLSYILDFPSLGTAGYGVSFPEANGVIPAFDDFRRKIVTTTNNTATLIDSIAIPLNLTVMVEAKIIGRRTGGSAGTTGDSATYIRTLRVRNLGGTVTIETLQTDFTSEDQVGWDVTFNANSSNLEMKVIGATNNNINWISIISTFVN